MSSNRQEPGGRRAGRQVTDQRETVEVHLGGRTVTVPRGGLYDRYRMDTDLDEVARDPRVSGVDFFRKLPKTRVDSAIGPTLTPNFYYRVSTARLTMLAPSRAIRARLPKELAPLEVAPGLRLVSVMFFRYDVCDIDFYTEAAVGIAVRPARHGKLGFFDLVSGLKNEHLDSYVLSLPVSTEIAQARGHDGYGFPKWVTGLDVDIDAHRTTARGQRHGWGGPLPLRGHTRPDRAPQRRACLLAHLVHDHRQRVALHPESDQRAGGRYGTLPAHPRPPGRAGPHGGRPAVAQAHQDGPVRRRVRGPARPAHAGPHLGPQP